MAEPDEAGTDEAVVVSAEEEGLEATSESLAQLGGSGSNEIACNGTGHWCLATCSKTGTYLHVVGTSGQLGGHCVTPSEAFCKAKKLGYRTSACWGHL